MARDNIRNFCIIAHIDHGKSTLSDRILELTKSVDERTMEDQILDNMDIERERGITIKARAVTMNYTAKDGKTYEFNLIDTPGHVDFAYEVSRSLAACEGAILVVDATQGVEAQTLANTYMALEHDLELVPILNKIDLPSAHPDEVAQEVEDVIGLPCLDAPRVSAKTGLNVDQVLERVVTDIPAPTGDPDAPLKALIFDSIYDSYKGVIVYIRVFEGTVKPGDTIRMMATGAEFTLVEVGHMGATNLTPCAQLQAGEVGYLTASIKTVQDTRVGDTVTLASRPTAEALPGETFLGTVEKVNINGTTTDGFTTYPVTILLSEYGALNPGMNVSADIIVEQAQQVLCIPTPAVSGGNTVLVAQDGALGEDGSVLDPAKLETRQVELGRSSQDYVEILSGLEEGETVLVPIQSADSSAGSTAVMASGG